MPGFLMGLLQFGWLGVNAYMVSEVLCTCFGFSPAAPGWHHGIIASVFAIVAAFVGLKGIRYVGRVGTYLPLIPVIILIVLFATCLGGVGKYRVGLYHTPAQMDQAEVERQAEIERLRALERNSSDQLPPDEGMNPEVRPPQPPPPPKAPPPVVRPARPR